MKLANFNRENADVLAGGAAITANAAVSTHASGTASVHLASAVTIADSGGHFTSSTVEGALQELGAASSDMLIYDESSLAGTATSFDFQGAGVSAAVSGGTAVVTVTGGTASANIPIYDEGSLMGTATTGLNFTGSGVAGTVTSGTAVITITGATGDNDRYQSTANKTSISGTAFADIPGADLTLTTGASRCLIIFSGWAYASSGSGQVFITFTVDGSDVSSGRGVVSQYVTTSATGNLSTVFLTDALSSGSHTFKARIGTDATSVTLSGSGTAPDGKYAFAVQELA